MCDDQDYSRIIIMPVGVEHGRSRYKLVRPYLHKIGPHVGILVPEGFVTDFASVPRILWSLFPTTGEYSSAALVHDYLYGSHNLSRFLADAIFRAIMRQQGVPLWKCMAMYLGVRIGGYFAWKNNQSEPQRKFVADVGDMKVEPDRIASLTEPAEIEVTK